MKYLFVIQGEGRGHLTQALSLKEMLQRNGDEVVEMLVGKSSHRQLPDFFMRKAQVPIQTFASPNFLPTAANKRNALGRSVAYNLTRVPDFVKSITFIVHRIHETHADAVINFYELLTGLTFGLMKILQRDSIPYYCIGHQYLFLHKDFQLPQTSRGNLFLLKLFTRMTSLGCKRRLALSFREMDADKKLRISVVPPLLRKEILGASAQNGDYILGYMVNSGFAADVEAYHKQHPQIQLHFFWDKKNAQNITHIDSTLTYHKVDDHAFLEHMCSCKAYATTAGFESVCEAIYLGKPVLMVPAHIEQDCNAWDAMQLGAGIIGHDFNLTPLLDFINKYQRITNFPRWVRMAEFRILPLLKPTIEPTETPNWLSTSPWTHILGGSI